MADDAPTLELRIQDNSEKAVQGIKSLASSLLELQKKASQELGLDKVVQQLDTFNQKLQATFSNEAVDKINKVADAIEKLASVREVKIPEISVGKAVQEAVSGASLMPEDMGQAVAVQGVTEAADQMRDYTRTVEEAKAEASQLEENVADVDTKMEDQARSAINASDAVKEHAMSLKDLAGAAKKTISPLDKVIKSFNRILFYRVIRSVLKEIAKGFSEGIKNVRAYSKAISGSFDKAMTGAENSLFKLKNSLGAALAPALEAIIPHVQNLVSWFITLINYVNQFIALITGKSQWTRAIDASAASFEKTKKSAAGAAKEVKNLLAGFDELNIIQRESGGGGGGAGKIEPDYTTAFEEVYTFDEKIKNIVNWLKDNMEALKAIAIDLGSLFLAWRVSNAFSGMIGKLGSLIAAGALIKLTWDITTILDDEYLKTGDIGWLIANVVETAVGAFIGGNIAKQILGAGKASAGVSIILTVSALADIVADIQHVDVSALSKESIGLLLTAAVKGGAAGVFIAKTLQKFGLAKGLSGGQMVSIAGGASLATFGAGLTLKAMVNAVNTEEFGEENLRATIEGAVTLGAGLAWLGKTVGKYTTGKAAATGVSGFIATLGAYVGLEAIVEAKKVGYSDKFWEKTALASLDIGVVSFIQALAAGATLGTAGLVAGGAVVATVAAVVGVSALLKSDKDKIQWGNKDLTQQEIQEWVKNNMFSIPIEPTLELINTTLTASENEQAHLRTEAANLFKEVNALKLGVDTKNTLANINKQVFGDDGSGGIIGRFKKHAELQVNEIKTAFALMPEITINGQDIRGQYLGDAITGWTMVTEGMTKLGDELGGYLSKAANSSFEKGLSDVEKQAVDDILKTMIRISEATASGELGAKAATGLRFKFSDLSKGSTKEALKAFEEYRNELREGYKNIYTDSAEKYMVNIDNLYALAELAEKKNDLKTAQQYIDQAEKEKKEYLDFIENLDDIIESSVNAASKTGTEIIKNRFVQLFADQFGNTENFEALYNANADAIGAILADYYKDEESLDKGLSEQVAQKIAESVFAITGFTLEQLKEVGLEISDIIPQNILDYYNGAVNEAKRGWAKATAENAYGELEKQAQEVERLKKDVERYENTANNPSSWDYLTGKYQNAVRMLESGGGAFDTSGGLYAKLEAAEAKLEELKEKAVEAGATIDESILAGPVTPPDMNPVKETVVDASNTVDDAVDDMIKDLNRLSNASVNIKFDYSFWRGGAGGSKFATNMFRAGGGFVGTGDMFIARESGPELVGRIGNRTAVANNDQIVSGVASGVAAGQSEQNSLLRQQNDLLRQMLAKSGRVEAVPSADWGRFVKRSSEMYAYNTGM